ncbi:hypothetical protein BDW02DRAFT_579951 [Decorospora gaudefroyi]|uniref:Uncharacterized protein n=1 Tax=Decorospora gaudefroyi TaxID=184978 RepID=A0A6A5KE79_9PLEO|nr:hypothetical protein BDW02DRAFT_579951 [Decorospora gaudefroyi]
MSAVADAYDGSDSDVDIHLITYTPPGSEEHAPPQQKQTGDRYKTLSQILKESGLCMSSRGAFRSWDPTYGQFTRPMQQLKDEYHAALPNICAGHHYDDDADEMLLIAPTTEKKKKWSTVKVVSSAPKKKKWRTVKLVSSSTSQPGDKADCKPTIKDYRTKVEPSIISDGHDDPFMRQVGEDVTFVQPNGWPKEQQSDKLHYQAHLLQHFAAWKGLESRSDSRTCDGSNECSVCSPSSGNKLKAPAGQSGCDGCDEYTKCTLSELAPHDTLSANTGAKLRTTAARDHFPDTVGVQSDSPIPMEAMDLEDLPQVMQDEIFAQFLAETGARDYHPKRGEKTILSTRTPEHCCWQDDDHEHFVPHEQEEKTDEFVPAPAGFGWEAVWQGGWADGGHDSNGWPADSHRANDDDGGAANVPEFKVPVASTTYTVTYWATIESGDDSVHIPIDSNNVRDPQKDIFEGAGMKKLWNWVQEKGLGEKVSLQDAFDLARDMHGEKEDSESMAEEWESIKPTSRSSSSDCSPDVPDRTRGPVPTPWMDSSAPSPLGSW